MDRAGQVQRFPALRSPARHGISRLSKRGRRLFPSCRPEATEGRPSVAGVSCRRGREDAADFNHLTSALDVSQRRAGHFPTIATRIPPALGTPALRCCLALPALPRLWQTVLRCFVPWMHSNADARSSQSVPGIPESSPAHQSSPGTARLIASSRSSVTRTRWAVKAMVPNGMTRLVLEQSPDSPTTSPREGVSAQHMHARGKVQGGACGSPTQTMIPPALERCENDATPLCAGGKPARLSGGVLFVVAIA